VHIWAPNTPERPWVLGPERAHLPVPLDAKTVIGMMDEAGVERAILVPPSLDGDRNDLCLRAACDYPNRFAVMGRLQLDHPKASARLEAMKREPGLLGVRLTFHRDNDRPLLTNGKADWFWPAAEELGLPVMVHAPERLAEIGAIAERHSRLQLIVDHMGFARDTIDDEADAGARRILALAKHSNVSVKVSAVPCYSTQRYPFRNLHDPLKQIIDGFGTRRAFWGSDVSRILQHCSYRQAVTMFTEELDFLSASDLDWVMGRGLLELLDWE
jgi:predicted TIM-barrel fold metal-dependent hydrolase